jgi:hypothetical protein
VEDAEIPRADNAGASGAVQPSPAALTNSVYPAPPRPGKITIGNAPLRPNHRLAKTNRRINPPADSHRKTSMHPAIQKTLGGLSMQYYFRQFFFGCAIAAFIFFMSTQGERSMSANMLFFIVVSTLLYPYSRFVYESVIGFVMGENVFFVNAIFMILTKFITMAMCWVCAIFVAPIGFAYLYYHHCKAER